MLDGKEAAGGQAAHKVLSDLGHRRFCLRDHLTPEPCQRFCDSSALFAPCRSIPNNVLTQAILYLVLFRCPEQSDTEIEYCLIYKPLVPCDFL